MSSPFREKVLAFNAMYKLPTPATPELARVIQGGPQFARMNNFKKILGEEMEEFSEVIDMLLRRNTHQGIPGTKESCLDVLVALADVLGDIQVYCASEMAKYGMDNDAVLAIIMGSNLSKLGADGQPIYDERGKVMKGPNYWKPEPKLRALLSAQMATATLEGVPVRTLSHTGGNPPFERPPRPSAQPTAAVYVDDIFQGHVPVPLEAEIVYQKTDATSSDEAHYSRGD